MVTASKTDPKISDPQIGTNPKGAESHLGSYPAEAERSTMLLRNRLAISSQKGGVAKTTTTLSLGAVLAEMNLRVLVIDLDAQGHLTQGLGVDPESLRSTIGDVLLQQATLLEVSRETAVPNLDLVPANRGLILVEKILHNTKGYETRLRQALDALGGRYYDMVCVDCPPSFGPLTINALTACGMVIIPVHCDYYSAQSLKTYLNLLAMVRRNTNPNLQHRLLVTMFDSRTRLAQMVLEQYRRHFREVLFQTLIPLDSKLRESPIVGAPITQYASKARGAQVYRALANELLQLLQAVGMSIPR